MAVCPNCGVNNPEGSICCGNCGAEFNHYETPAAAYAPPEPMYPPEPAYQQDPMYPQGPMAPQPQDNSKLKVILPIVIGILLLALIGGVVFFVTHHKKAQEALPDNSYTTSAATDNSGNSTTNHQTINGEEATLAQRTTTTTQSTGGSNISDADYNDMELLLSNFAEVEVKDYDAANYSMETIISFSLFHRYINNSGGFQYGDPCTLPSEAVKKDAKRFFNLTLTESDMQGIPLAYYDASTQLYRYDMFSFDYYILHTKIDYNACHVVAVPTDITMNGDGSYLVDFTIYQSESAISDSEYKHRPDDAALTARYTQIGTGSATLEKHSGNEYSNYLVTEYHATY